MDVFLPLEAHKGRVEGKKTEFIGRTSFNRALFILARQSRAVRLFWENVRACRSLFEKFFDFRALQLLSSSDAIYNFSNPECFRLAIGNIRIGNVFA